jgi:D-glycero-D-manno-heptose 1,7-bisphosphate phosphatase
MTMMTPQAFFFDRDGTVNVSPGPGYVLRWEDFHFMPGVQDMLSAVKARGWRAILVTSQQGVGKGLMTQAELDHIHTQMQQALGTLAFDGIYACTGLDGTDPRRKPSPLMLQEAAQEHQLDLSQCWNVGDKERDLDMGRAAGVPHNLHLGSPAFPDWASILHHFTAHVPL